MQCSPGPPCSQAEQAAEHHALSQTRHEGEERSVMHHLHCSPGPPFSQAEQVAECAMRIAVCFRVQTCSSHRIVVSACQYKWCTDDTFWKMHEPAGSAHQGRLFRRQSKRRSTRWWGWGGACGRPSGPGSLLMAPSGPCAPGPHGAPSPPLPPPPTPSASGAGPSLPPPLHPLSRPHWLAVHPHNDAPLSCPLTTDVGCQAML